MNKQKVYNYIMNTPYNTNPNVLGSLLDESVSWNDLTDRPFYEEFVDTELFSSERTSSFESTYGVFAVYVTFPEELEEQPKSYTITLDGVEYKDLTAVEIPGMAFVCGNLYFLNTLLGTSFENTGEPFLAAFSIDGATIFVLDTAPTDHSIKIVATIWGAYPMSQKFVEIPTFDLNEIGLPVIQLDGKEVTTDADNTELYKALRKGCVRLKFTVGSSKWFGIAYPVSEHYSNSVYCVFQKWWDGIVFIKVYHEFIDDVMKSEIRGVFKRPVYET